MNIPYTRETTPGMKLTIKLKSDSPWQRVTHFGSIFSKINITSDTYIQIRYSKKKTNQLGH